MIAQAPALHAQPESFGDLERVHEIVARVSGRMEALHDAFGVPLGLDGLDAPARERSN